MGVGDHQVIIQKAFLRELCPAERALRVRLVLSSVSSHVYLYRADGVWHSSPHSRQWWFSLAVWLSWYWSGTSYWLNCVVVMVLVRDSYWLSCVVVMVLVRDSCWLSCVVVMVLVRDSYCRKPLHDVRPETGIPDFSCMGEDKVLVDVKSNQTMTGARTIPVSPYSLVSRKQNTKRI
ncbi:hypothetical protein J4Q44_G00291630 [Coregonus suidteri]|uniref:Uncharacterized protein n=1 Tax=Coregonus suidteri TaxID=861788 RepID=A0AAN8L4C5_9TELE